MGLAIFSVFVLCSCALSAAQDAVRVSTAQELQSALRNGAQNIVVADHIQLPSSGDDAESGALPAVEAATQSIRVRFKYLCAHARNNLHNARCVAGDLTM